MLVMSSSMRERERGTLPFYTISCLGNCVVLTCKMGRPAWLLYPVGQLVHSGQLNLPLCPVMLCQLIGRTKTLLILN